MYDVIIIGGGASGLLCAYYAASAGCGTAVLERNNKPGKKLCATGNGRCNYLNFNYPGSDLLFSELWKIGLVGVKEEEGRFYPRSREAAIVPQLLAAAAKKAGAEIICDCHVTDVKKKNGIFTLLSSDGNKRECRRLVLATGGKAGIQYGCYGEAYRWAQNMGHTLVKPVPALVPMTAEEDISSLHGVRIRAEARLLKNGTAPAQKAGDAAVRDSGKPAAQNRVEVAAQDAGEVQFTKDSISGICIMNLSGKLRLASGVRYTLSLDLFPECSGTELEKLMENQLKSCGDPLSCLLPEKLASYIRLRAKELKKLKGGFCLPDEDCRNTSDLLYREKESGGDSGCKQDDAVNPSRPGQNEMPRSGDYPGCLPEAEIKILASLGKNLCFSIKGTKGWDAAQVTSGGIPLAELDPESFESLKLPGLYIIGEAADYDGPCGGYNLSFAWQSAMLAGRDIGKRR